MKNIITPYVVKKFEKNPKILIVISHYYEEISENLLIGSSKILEDFQIKPEIIKVPGALEIPTAISLKKDFFDGFIALGCVIRGKTLHYEIVCKESAHFLSKLGFKGICIRNGILNCENYDQALERSDPKNQNKGGDAALATLSLVSIKLG